MLIVWSSIYTPFRVSFVEEEQIGLIVVETIVDLFFLVDICLTFFSAYYDSHDVLVAKKSQIICNYMKFWFVVDVIAVVPVSLIVGRTGQVQ